MYAVELVGMYLFMSVKPCISPSRKDLIWTDYNLDIKCMIGIGASFKTTPLLDALGIIQISDTVDFNLVGLLLRNIMSNSSAAIETVAAKTVVKENTDGMVDRLRILLKRKHCQESFSLYKTFVKGFLIYSFFYLYASC